MGCVLVNKFGIKVIIERETMKNLNNNIPLYLDEAAYFGLLL